MLKPLAGGAIVGALVWGMAGCASPRLQADNTPGSISQELAEAAASKPKAAARDLVGQAMLPPLQLELPVDGRKPEPRFNLSVHDAPASQVLMALVEGTPYSMLVPPDLSGTLTLNLKAVTVREALETIRELYGYEYKLQGNRIIIQPNTMQIRVFQINYLASRREGSSDTRVTSSSLTIASPSATAAGGSTPAPASSGATAIVNSSRVQTILDNDLWKSLQAALDAIIGSEEGRRVILNPVSGVILVKAMPAEMRAVETYLKATQLMVERQVMLEAKIIDVQLNDSFQAGINWAAFDKLGRHRWSNNANLEPFDITGSAARTFNPATGQLSTVPLGGREGVLNAFPGTKGVVGLAFQTGSFSALINFLETQGSVYVMSSPRIATINNQKAVLKVGTDEYFVTNVSTTTTTSTTTSQASPTITTQPFFSGIALDVTPQVDDEGNIILHVHPVVTEVSEKAKQLDLGSLGGNITLPLASSSINETDSIVRVQDGHIVAIGGLMSRNQRKRSDGLPGLHRAPGFGALFGLTNDAADKRELVILIKPTVIQNDASWQQGTQEVQDRIQALAPRRAESTPE